MQGTYRNKGGMKQDQRVFRVYLNDQIKAPYIIIINAEGEKIGRFPRRKALEMAEEEGLDLVQISYDAKDMVSTVKMVDYGKYTYEKQKEEKEKRKNQKKRVMKELKLSYMIGDNDLQLKKKKAIELLKEGYSVKISIRLRGREKMYADSAKEKLEKVIGDLLEYGRPQTTTPKQEAHGYSITLFTKTK